MPNSENGDSAAYFYEANRPNRMHLVATPQPYDVIDCAQRSPEWFAARAGRVTSSQMHLVFQKGRGKDTESKQRRDYVMRLACETNIGMSLDDPDEYRGKWVERGKKLEPEARGAYEAQFGVLVQTVGFLAHRTRPVGSSLDGFVGGLGKVVTEFKCPKTTTHWDYVNRGVLPEDYQYQVMTHLWLTDCERVDFISYCPEMPKALRFFVRPIRRSSFTPESWALFDSKLSDFFADLRDLTAAIGERAAVIALTAQGEALR